MNQTVLAEAARRFGTTVGEFRKLHDSFGSFLHGRFLEKSLYEYERNGRTYLLRFTSPHYVDFSLISGEAKWVNYLAENSVSVPRAIASEEGNLVEVIRAPDESAGENSGYAVVSFEKLPGHPIDFDSKVEWNRTFIQTYGTMIGKVHSLSKRLAGEGNMPIRMSWHEQDWFAGIDRYVPASDSLVHAKLRDVLEEMHSLPRDSESFGLIHGDAHPWNLIVSRGQPVLIDFDFCEYNWFAFEIAIALWYAIMQFPLFLRSRLLAKYILRYPDRVSGRITEKQKQAFVGWRDKIEKDIPYIDMDFAEFG
jgi:Ser/Thr protein kinase RdoA (MazF antagonist)